MDEAAIQKEISAVRATLTHRLSVLRGADEEESKEKGKVKQRLL